MTTDPRLADVALDAAAEVVRKLTGLVFPPVRRGALSQGLTRAMRRAGVHELSGYLARLATDHALLEDLASEITVGESYFFRDPEQVALVVELVREASVRFHRTPLRVWSAGCAGGEEPYTVAIALHRAGLAGMVRVLGTDLSPRALERARRGRYSRWSLRGLDRGVEQSFFRPVGDELELIPGIRSAVELRCLNLAEDVYPSLASGVWGMDVIVCRNVLIYFDHDTAAGVTRRLLDSLSPRGWLVLGGSDPTIVEHGACQAVVTRAGLAYRRGGHPAQEGPGAAGSVESVRGPPTQTADRAGRAPTPPSETALPGPEPRSAGQAELSEPSIEALVEEAARLYATRAYDRAAALPTGTT